nr:uncharacterized protein I303_03475 [Kwoniella dejecticola CBS 10117]OBR85763.1 hypothetical protein I303_03475 [Kwoniella dejecticola CBS 10117]
MDEEAKKKWQRSKPPGVVVGLPGYLVGGEWVGTMEDFEDAVETQTLESFLKQDIDLSHPPAASHAGDAGTSAGQKSIQEVELEKLMREMTSEDLDKLIGELDVNEKDKVEIGKIGLLDTHHQSGTSGETPTAMSDVKETDKGLLGELQSELKKDKDEDKLLDRLEGPGEGEGDETALLTMSKEEVTPQGNDLVLAAVDDSKQIDNPAADQESGGEGIKGLVSESDVLKGLSDELTLDKNEDKDLSEIVGKDKEKVD